MRHLGDIKGIDGWAIPPVDVITGGSPCQDLSVAGKGAGLAGERSGLFLEQMRVVREMYAATGGACPRYMIWENVPGAMGSNGGKDFREVLNECVKVCEENAPDVPVPKKGGWPKAGVLYDEMGRWSIAWRVHDAQFWGVPQRRRRIALVCDFGGRSAPEILFERDGVQGDSGTGGTPGARIAGNTAGGPGIPDQSVFDMRGNGSGKIAASLTGDHDSRVSDYSNCVVTVNAGGGGSDFSIGEGVSVPITANARVGAAFDWVTLNGTRSPVVTDGEKAPTIVGKGPGGIAETVSIEGNGTRPGHRGPGYSKEGEPMYTLNATEQHKVAHATGGIPRVRRLTPLECTRLQGYPDGWVDIGDWTDTRGKLRKDSDAPKYKALGNSIALPFWRWLLHRIYGEVRKYETAPTLGSLFDGIGGFPLCWPGETVWSSEIDDFPLAVLRARFGE